jgi:branched-chain amino acid transport system ATP-binding protein
MLAPKLMLLDEPSFGLAPMLVRELFSILRDIRAREGVSMMLVEQNAAMALELADHAYLIETGRVVLHGTSQELRSNDAVRRSYLGYGWKRSFTKSWRASRRAASTPASRLRW